MRQLLNKSQLISRPQVMARSDDQLLAIKDCEAVVFPDADAVRSLVLECEETNKRPSNRVSFVDWNINESISRQSFQR